MKKLSEGRIQRVLEAEKIYNLRELGGYAAHNAKQVKRGVFFRSGELFSMSGKDKKMLEKRGVKTIVDFRSGAERAAAPDPAVDTVTRCVDLPINAGNLVEPRRTEGEAEKEMLRLYAALTEEAIPPYRDFFSLLSEPANIPVLYHCTAGKDRTGLASAVLLYALGADMETIFEDYLESAVHYSKHYRSVYEEKPYMFPYMTVQKSYLETAFAAMEKYGGIDAYIQNELNADTRHLRNLYTLERSGR